MNGKFSTYIMKMVHVVLNVLIFFIFIFHLQKNCFHSMSEFEELYSVEYFKWFRSWPEYRVFISRGFVSVVPCSKDKASFSLVHPGSSEIVVLQTRPLNVNYPLCPDGHLQDRSSALWCPTPLVTKVPRNSPKYSW